MPILEKKEEFVRKIRKEIETSKDEFFKEFLKEKIKCFEISVKEKRTKDEQRIVKEIVQYITEYSTNSSTSCNPSTNSNVRSSSQSGSQSICSTNSSNKTSSPYNLDPFGGSTSLRSQQADLEVIDALTNLEPFGGSTSLRLQQANLQKEAIERRQKRYNNFGREPKKDCNPNSPNQTSILVCNGYPRNSNTSRPSFRNIGNGENHCSLAASLGIITEIPGLITELNKIFTIDLNRDWNSALYYSIQFKLNENEGHSSNNTDGNNLGDPLGFLEFLQPYEFFKYRQLIFNTIYELECGLVENEIDLDNIVGIIFSDVTFRGERLNLRNVCSLQDSNINHWKSLIKTESDFYLFDSIQGGYKPDVRYSFNEAFVMLLSKPFYIIYIDENSKALQDIKKR